VTIPVTNQEHILFMERLIHERGICKEAVIQGLSQKEVPQKILVGLQGFLQAKGFNYSNNLE